MDCSWEILLSDYCGNEPDIRTFKTVKDRGFFCPSYLYPYDITYNVRFNFIEEHFKKHTKGLTIKRQFLKVFTNIEELLDCFEVLQIKN